MGVVGVDGWEWLEETEMDFWNGGLLLGLVFVLLFTTCMFDVLLFVETTAMDTCVLLLLLLFELLLLLRICTLLLVTVAFNCAPLAG